MYETVAANYMEDAAESTLPAVNLTDDILSIQIASLALIYVSAAGKTLAKANDLMWRRGRRGSESESWILWREKKKKREQKNTHKGFI